jgi:hypothetical protein
LYQKLTGSDPPTAAPMETDSDSSSDEDSDSEDGSTDDESEEERPLQLRQTINPQEFYSALRSVGHKDEPFLQLSADRIQELLIHLHTNGVYLMEAYRDLGFRVSEEYQKWWRTQHGAVVWSEIKRKFPDYLEDFVLHPADDPNFERIVPKKTKEQIETTIKELKVAIQNSIKDQEAMLKRWGA